MEFGRLLRVTRDALAHVITGESLPTEAIRNNEQLAPFFVSVGDFRGLYGNLSESSLAFRYTTAVSEAASFWAQIDQRVRGTPWERLSSDEQVRRFQCVSPRDGKRRAFAAELRICYDAATRAVTIAHVCDHSEEDITAFAELPRARFADRVVWPKMHCP
jgi:hypothetical protein